ncbi:Uncharacterized protein dnm_008130 [Desulfonema magnum]|uniref:Uncharacterized protein n=1 Tax=Desulfonema magnum TaxID=45655 RepID=A0A975BGE4_9BACT|nr:Uncharacterized protein dnm_008130 [Desulfonema magnum]
MLFRRRKNIIFALRTRSELPKTALGKGVRGQRAGRLSWFIVSELSGDIADKIPKNFWPGTYNTHLQSADENFSP